MLYALNDIGYICSCERLDYYYYIFMGFGCPFLYFWRMTDDICKQVTLSCGRYCCSLLLLLVAYTARRRLYFISLVACHLLLCCHFLVLTFFLLLQVCIFYLVLRALDTVGMYLFPLVLCFLNVLLLIMFERFNLACFSLSLYSTH